MFNPMKSSVSVRKNSHSLLFIFFIVLLVLSIIEYCVFVKELGDFGPNKLVSLLKCTGDIALIYSLYFFIPNSKKWIILIAQWLISIFFISNILYYRFNGELLSPFIYKLTGNINQDLIESTKMLIRWKDITYLMIPVITDILYYLLFRTQKFTRPASLSIKIKFVAFLTCLFLYALSQCAHIVTLRKHEFSEWKTNIHPLKYTISQHYNWNIFGALPGFFCTKGLALYISRATYELLSEMIKKTDHITLSDTQRTAIRNFTINTPIHPDSVSFKDNGCKNMILIIVESLNSYVINKRIDGVELTPVLNKLLRDEENISSLNMRVQVKDGISSDGQLLINTGLKPLDKGVVSIDFGETNKFPALPYKLPDHKSVAIFADTGIYWNQLQTYHNYGFNKIYTLSDFFTQSKHRGNDGAMFDQALKIIGTLGNPFFLELVTYSTHSPFRIKIDDKTVMPQWLENISNMDAIEKNYYNSIHYFDKELGKFIEKLKQNNLWDNSIVIITSDHSQTLALGKAGLGMSLSKIPIVFIALNAGVNKEISTPTGQANIYPTILQIMGALKPGEYNGLDRSLLDPNLKSVIDADGNIHGENIPVEIERQLMADSISALIHKGDYFRTITQHK